MTQNQNLKQQIKDMEIYVSYLEGELMDSADVLEWNDLLLLMSPRAIVTGKARDKESMVYFKEIEED